MNPRVEKQRCAAAVREVIALSEDLFRIVCRHDPDAPDHGDPIGPVFDDAMRAAADAEYRAEIAGYGGVASHMREVMARLAVADVDAARAAAERALRNLDVGDR